MVSPAERRCLRVIADARGTVMLDVVAAVVAPKSVRGLVLLLG